MSKDAGRAVSFEGEVVIVTGGGRGLGRAYCLDLASRGASVVVNDVAREAAEEIVSEISDAGGVAVASGDSIATPEGGVAIVERAVEAFGGVDALINNAGIMSNGFFEDLTIEQIDSVIDVNLRGYLYVTQPAWRIMKSRGYGRIVMTSSAAGMFSRVGSVNYSAAKAGLYGVTKALSFEGADHGIRVNMLLPRAATTISSGDLPPGLAALYTPEVRQMLSPRHGPVLTAPLVSYLASRSCEVTGEAFSSAFGSYARVFVGRSQGWLAPDLETVSAEDIAENIDAIRDRDGYSVPVGNWDEVETVLELIGAEQAP